jgi:hypothetical protein
MKPEHPVAVIPVIAPTGVLVALMVAVIEEHEPPARLACGRRVTVGAAVKYRPTTFAAVMGVPLSPIPPSAVPPSLLVPEEPPRVNAIDWVTVAVAAAPLPPVLVLSNVMIGATPFGATVDHGFTVVMEMT